MLASSSSDENTVRGERGGQSRRKVQERTCLVIGPWYDPAYKTGALCESTGDKVRTEVGE